MKLTGFFLLLAGCMIVVGAIALLPFSLVARNAFVMAGFATEVFGLVLVFRSHLSLPETR